MATVTSGVEPRTATRPGVRTLQSGWIVAMLNHVSCNIFTIIRDVDSPLPLDDEVGRTAEMAWCWSIL
jgi:hypothetical protein